MCTSCSEPAHVERALSRRLLLGATGLGAVGAPAAAVAMSAPASAAAQVTRQQPNNRRGLHVTLLGTQGGPPPRADRAGMSTAVIVDGAVYMVDAGPSAVGQYVRAGLDLGDLAAVFITHLHIDHLADYFNLFLLGGWNSLAQGDTLSGTIPVFGPGPAGGLPATFGGGTSVTENPADPTPGLAALTDYAQDAYAYSTNVFVRDSLIRPTRSLADVHEIAIPDVGASYQHTAPSMAPFVVMEDDRVKVTAVLVPHGVVFPAFAYRFDTDYGSVTLSGDTTYTDNVPRLAHQSDLLIHEAVNVQGFNLPAAVLSHLLTSHVEVQKVGPIAQAADVPALVLSHIGDLDGGVLDQGRWRRWAQSGYHGTVHVGNDLDAFQVTKRGLIAQR